MSPVDVLTEGFEKNREHLRSIAYRMLGSAAEAEDAVQEAWLRSTRTDPEAVDNLGGWLTTVVARVCLDLLRARKARREVSDGPLPDAVADHADPERLLADSVGPAMLVVLETLGPAERIAFVLHDMFGVSFEEIAPILSRSALAARKLASRARRRVQGAPEVPDIDVSRQRRIVDAFLAASRNNDFDALMALLDPDVVIRADATAVRFGSAPEVRGAVAVAKTLKGRAQGARVALVDGLPGAAWVHRGQVRVVFDFKLVGDTIVEIELLGDPTTHAHMDLELT